jgi:hypothetical protein
MYEKNIDPLIRKAWIYQKDNQKPKDRQRNGQKKWDVKTTVVLKSLHRKLKIDQHGAYLKPAVHSGGRKW